MELKAGYKQTEIGVIPDDWEVKPLKRLSPRQCVGLVINPSSYFVDAGAVPMLVGSNVAENSINWITARRISEASNQLLAASRLSAGDLVTVRVGEPGLTSVVPPELDGCNCASMMIVRQHPSFDSHWLCFAMNSQIGRSQVEHVQYGTAQKQFNISHAVDFCFPVPPLPEQRAISEVLGHVDALQGALNRLIAKKRDLKQAAMQQLLTGQTRIPGFRGEWQTTTLEIVAEIQSGINKSVSEMGNGTLYVTVQDLYDGTSIAVSRLDRIRVSLGEIETKRLLPGDIVFGKSSVKREGIGYPSQFLGCNEPVVFSGFTYRARARSGISDPVFLFYVLRSEKCRRWLIDNSQSSALTNINQAIAASIPIKTCPLPEQTAVAEVLTDMDIELAALEQRLEKTRALKQAMMEELLTGKTRLLSSITNVTSLQKPEEEAEARPLSHNWQINEAAIIGALARQFGTEAWPLPRKRRAKLMYLLHRHAEGKAEGYLKKAAGPYSPETRYKGPESIALRNGYVREHNNGAYSGFVAAGNVAQAEMYFAEWYPAALLWLEQFRFEKTDELELLSTVDMAMEDLRSCRQRADLGAVKDVIRNHPEWEAKLTRPIFSDSNIAHAMSTCDRLFGSS